MTKHRVVDQEQVKLFRIASAQSNYRSFGSYCLRTVSHLVTNDRVVSFVVTNHRVVSFVLTKHGVVYSSLE